MPDQLTITETFHPDIRDIYPSSFIQASPKPISRRLFVCNRPFGVNWGPVLHKTLERVLEFIHQEPLLKDRNFLYFGSNDVQIMGSGSIQRYKKYWKNAFRPIDIDAGEFYDCVEVLIREHDNRLLYATCASVSEKHLPALFESLRLGRPGFVSIPARPLKMNEQLVQEYFDNAWDESSTYGDQQRICEYICRDGGIHIQIYGGFGDQELEFYLHYRPDLVPLSVD